MASIISKLPFGPGEEAVQGQTYHFKRQSIYVWVSVALPVRGRSPDGIANAAIFPALLHTAFNHDFAISVRHLSWIGLDPNFLPEPQDHIPVSQKPGEPSRKVSVPRFDLDVWLRPNKPGLRTPSQVLQPYLLETNGGILVFPEGMAQTPRFPVLGLGALQRKGLQVIIDTGEKKASVRSPGFLTSWFGLYRF